MTNSKIVLLTSIFSNTLGLIGVFSISEEWSGVPFLMFVASIAAILFCDMLLRRRGGVGMTRLQLGLSLVGSLLLASGFYNVAGSWLLLITALMLLVALGKLVLR